MCPTNAKPLPQKPEGMNVTHIEDCVMWFVHHKIDDCDVYLGDLDECVVHECKLSAIVGGAEVSKEEGTILMFDEEYTFPWYAIVRSACASEENTVEYASELVRFFCSVFHADGILEDEIKQPFFNIFSKLLFFRDAG